MEQSSLPVSKDIIKKWLPLREETNFYFVTYRVLSFLNVTFAPKVQWNMELTKFERSNIKAFQFSSSKLILEVINFYGIFFCCNKNFFDKALCFLSLLLNYYFYRCMSIVSMFRLNFKQFWINLIINKISNNKR